MSYTDQQPVLPSFTMLTKESKSECKMLFQNIAKNTLNELTLEFVWCCLNS